MTGGRGMGLRVNVVCRNWSQDRVLPRFGRYLRDHPGWTLTPAPHGPADVVYLLAYFESQMCKVWPEVPVAAYFTHREEEPPGNRKAKLFDAIAGRVQLRVAMCRLYAGMLERCGPTATPPLPVERDRFTIPKRQRGVRLVAGFSGYTYSNRRKGEDLARAALASKAGAGLEWRASGRGWPVKTRRFTWAEMPGFYQGLDILVCTSRVEGGPMPVLEALSCGASVVIPRGVGILDELPHLPGIHRYARGDAADLVRALGQAVEMHGRADREALRAVTEPYTVKAFCRSHAEAFEAMLSAGAADGLAGLAEEFAPAEAPVEVVEEGPEPVKRGTNSTRGIYVVAFGDPARTCALRLMTSAKKFLPEIPICLCAAKKIGPEDVLVVQPDSDVGGRRAKLKAYELSPAEWQSVLYLDADTKVVGDIRFYFQLIEDGWEFVICKDPHLMDTMHAFRRSNNLAELHETAGTLYTLHTLQYNGGVWAFGRNERVRRFFARWLAEWERHAQRDQGALIRAMYTEPLRVYLLGNEWNTFEKYTKGIVTAGLMHYPGDARRWSGMIPGRIDSEAAWRMVRKHEGKGR
ncbi:MAG: glycosyltransferase [Anaerolineae bacterium]|nr:glycosyltransferase [Anaerolineae bacterium]